MGLNLSFIEELFQIEFYCKKLEIKFVATKLLNMKSHSMNREEVRKLMQYNIKDINIDPSVFDCIPPVYETPEETGWLLIAKSVITDNK